MNIHRHTKFFPHGIAGIIGFIIFFSLFSEIVSPTYIDWILNVKSDPFQHFTSWLFFRAGPWQLPLIASYIIYPIGASIVFTDSIPFFAIVFKLLDYSGIFPNAPIQYFGIWLLIGTVLQSIFSYTLIKKISHNTPVSIIGSILFVLSAPMMLRMMGHFALSTHAVILIALYLYTIPNSIRANIYWGILLILSLLIHAYLFIMIGSIYIAYIVRQWLVTKEIQYLQTLAIVSVHTLIVIGTMWAAGYFTVSNGGSSTGYGNFSMNVISLINPYDANGTPWSRILPIRGTGPYQHEGFNFIGIAALIQLGILFLGILFRQHIRSYIRTVWYSHWPLAVLCGLLTMFAVSSTIWIGPYLLIDIPLSEGISNLVNTFRSSGRFFWPVFYILLLSSFIIYRFLPSRISIVLITALVSLQIYDMWPRLAELDTRYEHRTYITKLQDPFWESAANNYSHIVMIPGFIPSRYEDITFYAATHGLTINDFLLARELPNQKAYTLKEIEQVAVGNLQDDTLYIIVDYRPQLYITSTTLQHADVQHIDGYTILTKQPYYETY